MADYEHPSTERDASHYTEFYKKVRFVSDDLLAEQVEEAIAMNDDIHFHTWTHESFAEMVTYIRREMFPGVRSGRNPALRKIQTQLSSILCWKSELLAA